MIVSGLLVRAVPGAIGDIAGGILYAVLVFLLVAILVPAASAVRIGLAAFAICVAVELLQLTGLPSALTAVFPPARLVLGTTFVTTDLVSSAVGVGLAVIADRLLRRPSGTLDGSVSARALLDERVDAGLEQPERRDNR